MAQSRFGQRESSFQLLARESNSYRKLEVILQSNRLLSCGCYKVGHFVTQRVCPLKKFKTTIEINLTEELHLIFLNNINENYHFLFLGKNFTWGLR